jgi:hypothetical protein
VALRARAAAAGVTPVGLRPPFVTPAAAHSHPDCRWILTLIVAPEWALVKKTWARTNGWNIGARLLFNRTHIATGKTSKDLQFSK